MPKLETRAKKARERDVQIGLGDQVLLHSLHQRGKSLAFAVIRTPDRCRP